MVSLIYLFIFLLGLIIGSFLNCIIYRLEHKKSLGGRSFCPRCKHILSWKDLFPVLSFAILRGKCRYCRRKISWQYPLVELATAVIFSLLAFFLGGNGALDLIFIFYIASVLIVIFVYDLKHSLIPDKILLPAILISFFYRLILDFGMIWNYLFAAAISAGFFFVIFLVSNGRWMGFGDVKLALFLGFVLGAPEIFLALFLAFLFGAIIGLILMAFKRKSIRSEIAFGPFLVIGAFLAILFSNQIIQWYLNLFRL